jgi:hypothetical protein
MKLNLKMIAVAAAMVASGVSNAAFVPGSSGTGNSTLGLLVWNTGTSAYYMRDLGYTLNTFLPTGGASITGTGETGATFDKTPAAGLVINGTNKAEFAADAAFGSWITGQTLTDIKWLVMASDTLGSASGVNTAREVVSFAQGSTFTNVSVGAITTGAGAMNGQFASGNISVTGTLSPAQLNSANGSFINQAGKATTLGGNADLYYFTRNNAGTGTAATGLNQQYANATGAAVLTLSTSGDLSYTLAGASAVPVPAAVWLLGSGLMALGAAARRRKAASQA